MITHPAGATDAHAFYKSALAAASFLDHEVPDQHLLDAEGDAAWRAYGDDLPLVIRVDTVLRNLAILYPAAFAPGPVFDLPGWYDDDPWGVGFERPPKEELEALWRQKTSVETVAAALEIAGKAWTVRIHKGLGERADALTPKTSIVVAGCGAVVELATAFSQRDNLELRSQVLLISDQPAPRQLFGLACAIARQSGTPRMLRSDTDVGRLSKLASEAGTVLAHMVVVSADATDQERQAARLLGEALGADNVMELGAA